MIEIFDSNIHFYNYSTDLNQNNIKNVNKNLEFEKNLTEYKIKFFLKHFQEELKKNNLYNYQYNLMIFDQNILNKNIDLVKLLRNVKSKTVLGNFKTKNFNSYIEKFVNNKINAVKFHRYFQNIKNKDFDNCLKLVRKIDKLKIPILIDTSYGTEKMYSHDNLEFAIEVLKNTKNSKVVLLHSGSLKVMEAYLIASKFENVILDTSFSLDYFKEFLIMDDFIRVYSKIGANRIIFGTDFPYVNLKPSLKNFLSIMKKCKFSTSEIKLIACQNSKKLFTI